MTFIEIGIKKSSFREKSFIRLISKLFKIELGQIFTSYEFYDFLNERSARLVIHELKNSLFSIKIDLTLSFEIEDKELYDKLGVISKTINEEIISGNFIGGSEFILFLPNEKVFYVNNYTLNKGRGFVDIEIGREIVNPYIS